MSPRALVVESSLTIRMHLGEALEAAGFDVVPCGCAADARRALPDGAAILVTDERLPDARGADLARDLALPAILLASPGEVDASSSSPAGHRVEVMYKPCDLAALTARAKDLAGPAPAANDGEPRARVLAVDDSATFRGRLEEVLAAEGYEVVSASSGEEALVRLASASVDCVLLDMFMPGMSGKETCRRIKAAPELRCIPVLMLTASDGTTPMVASLGAGADDFVTKSEDFTVLGARLRALVRRRRYEEENRRIREELFTARITVSRAEAERVLAETRARMLRDLEAKNAELERARDRAEAAVRARDEFLSIASHELRTPLTSLHLRIESLRRASRKGGASAAPERIAEGLDVAARQTERLGSLIDALLDASRLSAGRIELSPETFDLAAVVRDTADRLGDTARKAGSAITVLADGPVVGRWDRLRCEQVTTNLLSNAIKYGGGKPIDVEVRRDGVTARLVVQDRGIGIDEEQKGRIFEIFERAVSSRNYGGLGLGLYITRQLVEAHGGKIHVSSRPGAGSTFTVEIPLGDAA